MKFPKREDYGYIPGSVDAYFADDVEDWFKRCLQDFPEMVDKHYLDWTRGVLTWKHKWFSQFIEKGELMGKHCWVCDSTNLYDRGEHRIVPSDRYVCRNCGNVSDSVRLSEGTTK